MPIIWVLSFLYLFTFSDIRRPSTVPADCLKNGGLL